MTTLILIRHGETNKNVGGVLHNFIDVESLNDTGILQMKQTATELEELSVQKTYSSMEQRAIESANILGDHLRVPIEKISGLQERNWGVFTGKPWAMVKEVLDSMSVEERYEYIPQDGESWKDFERRLIAIVTEILMKNENKNIILVTHGGAIRALMPFFLSLPKEESFKYDPDNASITIFNFDGKIFQEKIKNDTSHLVTKPIQGEL